MSVLLDTDHVSILQGKERPAYEILQARLEKLPGDEINLCIVSIQEQVQGWLSYIRRARKDSQILRGFSGLQDILRHYSLRPVLPFEKSAQDEFMNLENMRIRIGTRDLRIAAIAKSCGAKLLSRNLRDFRQVPELDVEDWTV